MIAGFEMPTAGAVLLEGADVSSVPPHKRNVNTVFQQYALFPHMSIVRERRRSACARKQVPAAEARKRALEMLDVVKLAEFADRRPSQLSGGQQQRVALARALVNMPAALLLDEPLAALDLKLREAMQLELKRIQRDVGITFVFVTHDQGEALTMSDRIAVMSRGRVEQIGTPEEIYDRPASIFVAGFIGSANLLPAVVSAGSTASAAEGRPGDGRHDRRPSGRRHRAGRRRHRDAPPRAHDAPRRRAAPRPVGRRRDQGGHLPGLGDPSDHRPRPTHTEIIVAIDPDEATEQTKAGSLITLTWTPKLPFVLPGRTAIIGATSTDFDEVEATMAGELDADDDVDDGDRATPAATAGSPPRWRRSRSTGASSSSAVASSPRARSARWRSRASGAAAAAAAAAPPSPRRRPPAPGSATVPTRSRVINWTEYIDVTEDGAVGTIDRFQEETGIVGQLLGDLERQQRGVRQGVRRLPGRRQPHPVGHRRADLLAGPPASCPSDYLAPIPYNLIPNYVNLEPQYLNVTWDPGGKFNLPWQAGVTGFAYNIAETGRELRSINELFEPGVRRAHRPVHRDAGHARAGDARAGQRPGRTRREDTINEALDKIEQATEDGQVRRFTGNDYLQDIQNGNFAACIAWSGDIAQASNPDVRFVFPEEGAMSWFDTMVIPLNAPNGVAAAKFMDFVYDPVNAAQIAAYVQFISPVKGVQDELVKHGR